MTLGIVACFRRCHTCSPLLSTREHVLSGPLELMLLPSPRVAPLLLGRCLTEMMPKMMVWGSFFSRTTPPPPLLWIVTVIPKPRKPLSLFAQLGRHFFSGRFPFSTVLSLICVVFGCTRCFPSGICDWSLFLANVTGKRKPKKNVSNTLYSLCLTGDFVTQSASSRLRTKHQDMILKTEKRSQLIWISFANCDQSQTTYLQSSVNSNPYTLNHELLTPNPRL